ncbi:alpha/beta hydrolase [Rhizobacter sp. Root1221]|uniref:alpha/beta hydrolase n=1 Tax=Rhizobacter sp. Root1221 TaxID=1736433 RepID=UPI000700E42F|nr:alpha/beta fold hydrolase [Rhizobacter sp. Root1221]KQV91620.1 alpha/beta hydrolase [Rhizobacter sp. Root1221]
MPTSRRLTMPGPSGALEVVIDTPDGTPRGVAVVCHPHPLQGGTLDNKVAATLARAFVQLGYRAVRLNFRGVGASEGEWDEGRGEVDDALAVIAAHRDPALPLALAGFSFGGFVASQAASMLPEGQKAIGLVLVGPSTQKQKVPAVPEGTLVIHGEADDVVPLSATLDWARPQALPVVVIPGAGHFFHGQLPLLKTLVVRGWPH